MRRAAVLEGRPFVAPDDGVVGGNGEEPEAPPAEPERASKPRRRRNARGRFEPAVPRQLPEPRVLEPVEYRPGGVAGPGPRGVYLVPDDAPVVRLSEVAEVLNQGGDPGVLGVDMAEAVHSLLSAGWTTTWTRPGEG
jgi:hypothetical protein